MKTDYKKLLDDGVHPTTEGHQKIFGTVSAFLMKNKLL
jgi:phospholipase/lecithinase/hemolysin